MVKVTLSLELDNVYSIQSGFHAIGFSIDGGATYSIASCGNALIASGASDQFNEAPLLLSRSKSTSDPIYGYIFWRLNNLSLLKPLEAVTYGENSQLKPAIKRGVINTISDIDAIEFVAEKTYTSGTITIMGR